MDRDRFDRLARTVARGASRRQVVGAIAALITGGAVSSSRQPVVARQECGAGGHDCGSQADCCAALCCGGRCCAAGQTCDGKTCQDAAGAGHGAGGHDACHCACPTPEPCPTHDATTPGHASTAAPTAAPTHHPAPTGTPTAHPSGAEGTCPAGLVTCCTNPLDDPGNCGACGHACAAGRSCCNGACVDPLADRANCGRCGNACGKGEACCAGACARIATDPANCGGCGAACRAGAFQSATCVDGACQRVCFAGFADCNGDPSDGCEAYILGDPGNCGVCGSDCAIGESCIGGRCWANCPPTATICTIGTGDAIRNTYCADLNGDPNNCGRCGRRCTGGQLCQGGACVCPAVSTLCGSRCVDLATDNANCGACGVVCTQPLVCREGNCACPPGPGNNRTAACNGQCVDLDLDPGNCGACGTVCPRLPGWGGGTQAICLRGQCGYRCYALYADCDGDPATGCEAYLDYDPNNCGACGTVCAPPEVCFVRRCGCPSGGSRCGNVCVDLRADPNNCGACGNVCPRDRSTCYNGACAAMCLLDGQPCGNSPQCCSGMCERGSGRCCVGPGSRCSAQIPCCFGIPGSNGRCDDRGYCV